MLIVQDSSACHDDHSTGLSTSMGSTRSPMNNSASPRETKAHTTQSSCTFGQPTSRVAPARSFEATQHNRGGFLKATTKNERKRQRRLDQATTHEAEQTASTASAGKLRTAVDQRTQSTHTMFSSDASLKEAQAPSHSKGLARMEHILEALTFYLSLFLTGGDMAKWWRLNRYTWSEYVDRREV